MDARIYKILTAGEWRVALDMGVFVGAAVDLADGFIHFSTADQVADTARRHFAGQNDLLILAVDPEALGAALLWEVSRGGALFPHLYGPMPCAAVTEVRAAPLDASGVPDLGALPP